MSARRAVAAAACVLAAAAADLARPLAVVPARAADAAPDPSATRALALAPADASPVSQGIASSFVRPMTRAAPGEPVDFAWARLDVDGDGYDELVLSLTAPDRCGADGCPLLVMRRKADGAWTPVLATVGSQVRYRRDAPRRSLVLTVRTSRGDEDWSWDDGRALLVPSPPRRGAAPGG